jgi:hypothetical protein
MLRIFPMFAGLVGGLAMAFAAVADTPAAAREAVGGVAANLVEQLGDADYDVRHRATVKLLQTNTISPEDCLALYAQATGAEQRQRLLTVARHHLVRQLVARHPAGQRGSLGLMLAGAVALESPKLNRPGVRVLATFPGFPAYAHLEPGDLIVMLMGESMPDTDVPEQIRTAFIERASQLSPGQTVQLRVWRRGQLRDIQFPLASYDALDRMYSTADQSLRPPYHLEWQQLLRQLRQYDPPASPLTVDLADTTAAR